MPPPPGTKVIVHSKPYNQHTWDFHGLDSWYVSQSLEHYQSYKIYIINTHSEIISNTIELFPTQVNIPKISSADQATYTSKQIVNTLQNPAPAYPFATFGDVHIASLHQYAEIFQTAAPVHTIYTSPMPQVIIPLPKVPIMSPQRYSAWIHPSFLAPPVVHKILP